MPEQIQRRSALMAVYTEGASANGPNSEIGLMIHERHPLTMFDIGGDASDKAFLTAAEKAVGCPLPATPNTVISADTLRVLWLSPKRWLCVDSSDGFDVRDISVGAVNDVRDISVGAVNNVSSGRTVLRLHGPRLRDVLAKGCPLDLHLKNFRFGECAQSKIDGLNVLLDHIDDDTFDIYVARGFARTFWEWLIEAANEYGYLVEKPLIRPVITSNKAP